MTVKKGVAAAPGPQTKQLAPTLRIPFVRRCRLTRAEGEQPGLLLDLSLTGAYVETSQMPAGGEFLTVSFRVPGNDQVIRLQAVVAWVNPSQNHPVHSLPPGCGLRFVEVADQARRILWGVIQEYCLRNPMYRQYL